MKASWDKAMLKVIVRWVLFVIAFFYIVSGLGILYPGIIESWTLGIITKALSFKIHDSLLIPFVLFLIVHVVLTFLRGRKK